MPIEDNFIDEREFVYLVLEAFNEKIVRFNASLIINTMRERPGDQLNTRTSGALIEEAKNRKDVPHEKLETFLLEAYSEVSIELGIVGNENLRGAVLREKIAGQPIFVYEKKDEKKEQFTLNKTPKEIETYLNSLDPKKAQKEDTTLNQNPRLIIKAKAVILPIKGIEKFQLSYDMSTSLLSIKNEGTNNLQAFYCPCPDFGSQAMKTHYIQALLAYLTNEITLAAVQVSESDLDKLLRGTPMQLIKNEHPSSEEVEEYFNTANTGFYDFFIEKFNKALLSKPENDRDSFLLQFREHEEKFASAFEKMAVPKKEIINEIEAYIKKTEEFSLVRIFGDSQKTASKVKAATQLIGLIQAAEDFPRVLQYIERGIAFNNKLEGKIDKENRFGACLAQCLAMAKDYSTAASVSLESPAGEEGSAFKSADQLTSKKSFG